MGEAQDAETQALKVCVPTAVSLEGGAVAVVAEAVSLDDQGSVAPEEVDLVWPDAGVDLRRWKAVATAEGEESALELAACEIVVRPKLLRRDQAEVQCAADGALVDVAGHDGTQVLQGPGSLGDCDAVADDLKSAMKVEERWTLMPFRLSGPPSPGTVTSIVPS
jgi:hypothetical protein